MNCPSCGRNVSDGAFTCPYCNAPLELTQKITPLDKATWCKSCGALISTADAVCPKCGSLTGTVVVKRSVRDLKLPEIGDEPLPDPSPAEPEKKEEPEVQEVPADDGARIESAIPGPDSMTMTSRYERGPRIRSIGFAAIFAVVMIILISYMVTHPWPVDSSDSVTIVDSGSDSDGSVTTLDYLSGQDKSKVTTDDEEASTDSVYDSLASAYAELGELAEDLADNDELLRSDGVSSDADARADGQSASTSISLRISNLISELSELDDGAGTYTDQIQSLIKLGNWLRNYSDALSEAWELSVASDDPVADAESIIEPLTSQEATSGTNYYLELFNESYEDCEPEQAT